MGAILLLFVSGPFSSLSLLSLFFFDSLGASSFSDSLSRLPLSIVLTPLTELAALCVPPPPCVPGIGVCGGVHMGIPPTGAEFAAATPGTAPIEGVCWLSVTFGSGPGAKEPCVATDEADMERAGLAGRTGANEEGEAGKAGPPEFECLAFVGPEACVGVGVGVDWLDVVAAVVLIELGWLFGGPGCTCPSSPGGKVRHEQNPSDDVMRRVLPSVDLFTCQPKFCHGASGAHTKQGQ